MSFYGYHGETQAERTLGNRFHVDVEIRIDLSVAGRTDDIADTLDYSHVFELVRGVVEDQQFALLEAIAARIAEVLLIQPRIGSVKVRVGKQPPIAGVIDRCWVIIEREGGPALMSAVIVDGRAVAAELREELATQITEMKALGLAPPSLAVVLCGDDPASAIYVRNKGRAAERAGIRFRCTRHPGRAPPMNLSSWCGAWMPTMPSTGSSCSSRCPRRSIQTR